MASQRISSMSSLNNFFSQQNERVDNINEKLVAKTRNHSEGVNSGNDIIHNGRALDENSEWSNVYLSVFTKRRAINQIGVAYFDFLSETLYCGTVKDIEEIEKIKRKTMPLAIVTTSKPHETIYKKIKENELDQNSSFNVISTNRSDFTAENAKAQLKLLQIEDFPYKSKLGQNEQNLFLMSLIDFEQEEMISALGGLLTYLIKNRILNQLDDEAQPISIKSLKLIKGQNDVMVDKNTMKSLAIFVTESHPSVINSRHKKEGLSLFSYLNRTQTRAGRNLLREWLMYPTNNISKLQNRFDHIRGLIDNREFLQSVQDCLSGIKDVLRAMGRIRNYIADVKDWRAFYETLQNFIALFNLISNSDIDLQITNKIKECFSKDILKTCKLISTIVDFPNSSINKIRVKSNVSEELDTLKRYYLVLDDFLTQIADEDMQNGRFPDIIKSMNITYLPQLGFLVMVPIEENIPKGDVDGMAFQFSNEKYFFYKNKRTQQLDDECGDIDGIITDIETSIIQKLAEHAIANAENVIQISSFAAVLDALASLAVSAIEHALVCPELTADNVLIFKKGRHPLQEICVESQFIPNSSLIGKNGNSYLNVLTGPNNSGKSVYIKQCGLIAYMAHVGSFVPAEYARIGLMDMLFSRIQTQDNNTSSLSTFSSDARQVSYMLHHATPRSLLLIDEFGKGTSIEDGIGLLLAIIRHFAHFPASSKNLGEYPEVPRVLMSTHFHEIFTYGLLQRGDLVEFYKMEFVASGKRKGIEEIAFLYKVKLGVSRLSHGIACAKNAGYPPGTLERAVYIADCLCSKKEIEELENGRNRDLKGKCFKVLRHFRDIESGRGGSVVRLLEEIKKI